jgi:hypothetical protein
VATSFHCDKEKKEKATVMKIIPMPTNTVLTLHPRVEYNLTPKERVRE